MTRDRLIFAYGYLMEFHGTLPKRLPNGDKELPTGIPGYFIGDPEHPAKGTFEGRNNLEWALRKLKEQSLDPDIVVIDLDFEGLARDDTITLLLQPLQEDPKNYKTVEELTKSYFYPA